LIFTPGAVSGRHAKKIFPQLGQTKRFWFPLIPPSMDMPRLRDPAGEHSAARITAGGDCP
jgi:hypothetical protein